MQAAAVPMLCRSVEVFVSTVMPQGCHYPYLFRDTHEHNTAPEIYIMFHVRKQKIYIAPGEEKISKYLCVWKMSNKLGHNISHIGVHFYFWSLGSKMYTAECIAY